MQDKIYEELENCHNVSLEEILNVREKRVFRQIVLLEECKNQGLDMDSVTLICFTMNIAGPVKAFDLAKSGFEAGMKLIKEALDQENHVLLHHESEFENSGYTAYYVVENDALSVKRLTSAIEDNTSLGRLFDIDVLVFVQASDENKFNSSRKIARSEIGLQSRTCLICNDKAAICARSRKHSVEELQRKTIELLLTNKDYIV
jgi:holo-ACP synthase CitX